MFNYEPPEQDEFADYWCEPCDAYTEHTGKRKGMMYCNKCEAEFNSGEYMESVDEILVENWGNGDVQ